MLIENHSWKLVFAILVLIRSQKRTRFIPSRLNCTSSVNEICITSLGFAWSYWQEHAFQILDTEIFWCGRNTTVYHLMFAILANKERPCVLTFLWYYKVTLSLAKYILIYIHRIIFLKDFHYDFPKQMIFRQQYR